MYINILQLTFYEALNNIRPPQPSRPLPSVRQDEDALLQRYMYVILNPEYFYCLRQRQNVLFISVTTFVNKKAAKILTVTDYSRAIAESLALQSGDTTYPEILPETNSSSNLDDDLRLALQLSQQTLTEDEKRRKEEEEELERILKLSMQEK